MVSNDRDTFDAMSYLQNAFENYHQSVNDFFCLIWIVFVLFGQTYGYHAFQETNLKFNLEDSFHDSFVHPKHSHFLLQLDVNCVVLQLCFGSAFDSSWRH